MYNIMVHWWKYVAFIFAFIGVTNKLTSDFIESIFITFYNQSIFSEYFFIPDKYELISNIIYQNSSIVIKNNKTHYGVDLDVEFFKPVQTFYIRIMASQSENYNQTYLNFKFTACMKGRPGEDQQWMNMIWEDMKNYGNYSLECPIKTVIIVYKVQKPF